MAVTIQRGVQILGLSLDDVISGDRVSLSPGTCPAAEAKCDHPYCDDAMIPKFPWRPPTGDEALILTGGAVAAGEWIRVVSIPDDVLAAFPSFSAATDLSSQEILTLARSPRYFPAITALERYVQRWRARPDGCFENTGVAVKEPRLTTATFDDAAMSYVGLHVDTWYRSALLKRPFSPGRICVNLGCEERAFLYLNLPLRIMADELVRVGYRSPNRFSANRLAVTFCTVFPRYPVVRLAISPGQAYIAPTENIVHDASTRDQSYWDITFTIRGHFHAGEIGV